MKKNSKCNSKGAETVTHVTNVTNATQTVNMSILYQNSDLTQSKVYWSNKKHQFCRNWALHSLRSILHLRKIPNIAANWCIFSQNTPNQITLNHQILNLNKPKVYYIVTRHQSYIKSPWLAFRPLLDFRINSKRGNKLGKFSIKDYSLCVKVQAWLHEKSVRVITGITSWWIHHCLL